MLFIHLTLGIVELIFTNLFINFSFSYFIFLFLLSLLLAFKFFKFSDKKINFVPDEHLLLDLLNLSTFMILLNNY